MVKVLLALESPDWRELLRNLIEHEPGLELVGEAADPIDLLVEVKSRQADLVLQEWPAEELPGICSHLLIEYPDLLVVGIPRDSEHVFLCRQTVSTRRFPSTKLQEVLAKIRRRRWGR